jgi:hypothetical protein
MAQPIRPSTVLPAIRTAFTITTADGINLVGEIAAPIQTSSKPYWWRNDGLAYFKEGS